MMNFFHRDNLRWGQAITYLGTMIGRERGGSSELADEDKVVAVVVVVVGVESRVSVIRSLFLFSINVATMGWRLLVSFLGGDSSIGTDSLS
jgi:hypothetical protein